jgi:hypothetical protein
MANTQQNNASNSDSNDFKIPASMAENIRRLSHDLSNALEVVLQTNYLLGMMDAGGNEESRKWRAMLDQGVAQATQINRQLREYVREHS